MMSRNIVGMIQRDHHEDHYWTMEVFVSGVLVLVDAMVMPPKYLVYGASLCCA